MPSSPSFFAELKRRNVYRIAVAYAVAAWLLIQASSLLLLDQTFSSVREALGNLMQAAITMTSWEILLSKGQEWDWFGDPFLRVQTLAFLFIAGLVGLIFRENPLR